MATEPTTETGELTEADLEQAVGGIIAVGIQDTKLGVQGAVQFRKDVSKITPL